MSVYLISDGMGHIKIGSSTDLKARLKQLQTGNAYNLKVVKIFSVMRGWDTDLEFALHDRYAEYRIYNDNLDHGEWFYDACLNDLLSLQKEDLESLIKLYRKTKHTPEVHIVDERYCTVRQDTAVKCLEGLKKDVARLERGIKKRDAEIKKLSKKLNDAEIDELNAKIDELIEENEWLGGLVDEQYKVLSENGLSLKAPRKMFSVM